MTEYFGPSFRIPFILRNQEKWFSIKIFEWHLRKKFGGKNENQFVNLREFYYLHKRLVIATNGELEWLKSLTPTFTKDSKYPTQFKFEKLIHSNDAKQITKYYFDCTKMLENKFSDFYGFMQIHSKKNKGISISLTKKLKATNEKEFIVPVIKRFGKFLVPEFISMEIAGFVRYHPKALHPKQPPDRLVGIDMMYLKFLGKQIGLRVDVKLPMITCVELEPLEKFCQGCLAYWPKINDRFVNTLTDYKEGKRFYYDSADDSENEKENIFPSPLKVSIPFIGRKLESMSLSSNLIRITSSITQRRNMENESEPSAQSELNLAKRIKSEPETRACAGTSAHTMIGLQSWQSSLLKQEKTIDKDGVDRVVAFTKSETGPKFLVRWRDNSQEDSWCTLNFFCSPMKLQLCSMMNEYKSEKRGFHIKLE